MLDTIGDLLNPYSEAIGAIAGTVTLFQSLSGAFFLNDIRKRGSADGFSSMPFLGGIVITALSLKLASILNDNAMIRTNLIGLGINILYMGFFYVYVSKKNRPDIWKKVIYTGIFTAVCVTYANFEDPAKIEVRFGMLLTSMFVVLVGAPLLDIKDIIRKKSTENLPFPMILCGTFVGFMWFLYGVSIKSRVLIYQNGLMLLLSAPQLMLFAIYPRTPSKELTSKKSK